MEKLDCYYINRSTCAIVPIDSSSSIVYELDCSYIIEKSVRMIIADSCLYFGSSYSGRFDGSKKLLNMNYKLPIVIDEFKNLIFFPTSSPRFNDCMWISLSHIKSFDRVDNGSKVIFSNNQNLLLGISYYSLENQIFRATMLESLLRKRRDS